MTITSAILPTLGVPVGVPEGVPTGAATLDGEFAINELSRFHQQMSPVNSVNPKVCGINHPEPRKIGSGNN